MRARVASGGAALILVAALPVACASPRHISSSATITASTDADATVATSGLLAFESALNQAVRQPLDVFSQASQDANEAQAELQKAQGASNSQFSSAASNATATCQRDGYGSSQSIQAIDQEAAGASNAVQTAGAAIIVTRARAAKDFGTMSTALRQLGDVIQTQATGFAGLRFPAPARADADAVANTLSSAATAAQNAGSAASSSPAEARTDMDTFNGAMNQYKIALARLHADLGLAPPTAFPV